MHTYTYTHRQSFTPHTYSYLFCMPAHRTLHTYTHHTQTHTWSYIVIHSAHSCTLIHTQSMFSHSHTHMDPPSWWEEISWPWSETLTSSDWILGWELHMEPLRAGALEPTWHYVGASWHRHQQPWQVCSASSSLQAQATCFVQTQQVSPESAKS